MSTSTQGLLGDNQGGCVKVQAGLGPWARENSLLVSGVSKVCIFVLDISLSPEEEGNSSVLRDSVITGIDLLEADVVVNAAIIPKQPLHMLQPMPIFQAAWETCSIYHNNDVQCPVFHNYPDHLRIVQKVLIKKPKQ